MTKLPAGWMIIPKSSGGDTIDLEQHELTPCADCEYFRPRINQCDYWGRTTHPRGYCHKARKTDHGQL